MGKSILKTIQSYKEISDLLTYHSKYGERFAKHDCRNVFEKARKDLLSVGVNNLKDRNVLDLGCGQRFPFALQCSAVGANVTALDLDYVKPDILPIAFIKICKHNGLKRAFKSILRRILFDRNYYNALNKAAGKRLGEFSSFIKFIVADPRVEKYPIPSESFDLIASNAVVEHVENVSIFAKEIYRLLKCGGLFYANIHNYYSLSGGHNLDWAFPDENPSERVPPWDHLRKNRFFSDVPLNRLIPEEYKKAFSKHMALMSFEGRDINHDPGGFEGERFLTPEIEIELKDYPRKLLLTRLWLVICRKREDTNN